MSILTVATRFTAQDTISRKVQTITSNLQTFAAKADSAIAKVDRRLRRLTPSLGSLGKQILSFASAAALAGFFVSSAKSIAEYETTLASAQAITGASNSEFVIFRQNIEQVAQSTKRSNIEIAKGFEIVGSAAPELLKNAEALGAVTEASIILSKASGDDLETSARSLTGTMNQFSLTGGAAATRTMNVLAAGSVVGSANITRIGESMKNFGSVAAGSNITLEESVALVEVLGKFSLFGAEAGTKLRGATLKLQKAGIGYKSGLFSINDALEEAKDKYDKLSTARERDNFLNKTFGAENVSTGRILVNNIELFNKYKEGVTGTSIATEQAEINSNTFSNRLAELSAKWTNLITANTSSNNALGFFKDLIVSATNNLESIVTVVGVLIGLFFTMKAVVAAARLSMSLYSIALGVSSAMSGVAAVSIGSNATAMAAYTVVQWLANAALWGFPLTWIIGAFIAVGAGIAALIIYWDDLVSWITTSDSVFAKLIRFSLLPIIGLFKLIGFEIDLVSQAFSGMVNWVKTSDSGFAKFIRGTISVAIDHFNYLKESVMSVVDWLGDLWDMFSNFTSELFSPLLSLFDKVDTAIKSDLNDVVGTVEGEIEPVNPKAVEQDAIISRIETVEKSQSELLIKDETGRAELTTGTNVNNIKTSSTLTGGQ